MWKLIIFLGLVEGDPNEVMERPYLSLEECVYDANALGTELIKLGFVYDREMSVTFEAVVVDDGKTRAAFMCVEEPGQHV
jgi:hypothetical protein